MGSLVGGIRARVELEGPEPELEGVVHAAEVALVEPCKLAEEA